MKMGNNFQEINIFQGKLVSMIKAQTNLKTISKNNENFGCVILNVKDKELISAWKKAWKTIIPDYKIDDLKEDRCTVIKREFISNFPEMLIFQINRVEYTERFEAVKVNIPFDFKTELFIDQFMEENSEQIIKNESQNSDLSDEIEDLEMRLQKLENFYGDNQSLTGRSNQEISKILSTFMKNKIKIWMKISVYQEITQISSKI